MAAEASMGSGEVEVEAGKLFVGGLSWDTTKDSLSKHFSRFGELEDCTVMTNPEGRPRGFGFVKFKNHADTKVALCQAEHHLDGKKIDPKLATKNNQNGPVKVFVGGISQLTNEAELCCAFEEAFGKDCVIDKGVDIKKDRQNTDASHTGHRGFGFITFKSHDAAKAAVDQRWVTVGQKQVEVKFAENPKPKGLQGAYPSGGAGVYSGGYGGHSYPQEGRHMAPQQSYHPNYAAHYSGYQYPQTYNQTGYSNTSGGYSVYGQANSTAAHGQPMNSYDYQNGYGTATPRESSYPSQSQYTAYTQQQPVYQASGYGRSQQSYNGYHHPVHQ